MGVTLAAAGIGAAATMYAASSSASAAEDAASTAAGASKYAADMQWKQYEQNRKDMAPWRNVGQSGLYELARRMGLGTYQAPSVTRETFDWREYLKNNPQLTRGTASTAPYQYNQQGIMDAGSAASLTSGGPLRHPFGSEIYVDDYGNQMYLSGRTPVGYHGQPDVSYTDADLEALAWEDFVKSGGLEGKFVSGQGDGSDEYGQLLKRFGMDEFEADPGYQFRLAEGLKAVQGSAAARGGFFSGNTGIALNKYGQGMAADEYANAYNRYNQDMSNIYNRLAGVSGTGQTATQQVGNWGANAANAAGNYAMQGGLAQAGYQNQAGNAYAGAARGIGNQVMGAYGAYQQNQMYNDLMGQLYTGGMYNSGNDVYSRNLFSGGVPGSGMYDNYGDPIGG